MIPRRRRPVPAVVLLVLWPLFHHSYWRDAWILRIVGERYGPVLVRAGHPEAVSDRPAWALGFRRPSAVLAVSAVVVAAVVGFVIARGGSGGEAKLTANRHVSAGVLEVTLPTGWRREAAPAGLGPALTDEIVVHPAGTPGALVIGRTSSSTPGTLPASLLATLPSTPKPQPLTLAGAHFTRYDVIGSPNGTNASESIYSLPTSVGTVIGVCRTTESQSTFAGGCEQVLASLTIASGGSAPRLSPGYASGLTAAIGGLNAIRSTAGAQLQHAPNAHDQAVAADELAAAHAKAASELLRLRAGSARTANLAVVTALRETSQAYTQLASAADHSSQSGYSSAQGSLQRANNALKSAFGQLQSFGYKIG